MSFNKRNIFRYLASIIAAATIIIMLSVPAIELGNQEKTELTYLQTAISMNFDSSNLIDQLQHHYLDPTDKQRHADILPLLGLVAFLACLAAVFTILIQLINSITEVLAHIISIGNSVLLLLLCVHFKNEYVGVIGLDILILLSAIIMLITVLGIIRVIFAKSGGLSNSFRNNSQVDTTDYNSITLPLRQAGRIVGLNGMFKNISFNIDNNSEIIFGRDTQNCQIVFDQKSPLISRRHCSIRFIEATEQYAILDFSKFGTFTQDGRRLLSNSSITFTRGTIIYLGSIQNMFRLE